MEFIIRRSERDKLDPSHVPAHMQGRVSGTARGFEEADEIVRRYDRRSEGGPVLNPVLVTDARENERVEVEGHAKALGMEAADRMVKIRDHKRRVIYGPIS